MTKFTVKNSKFTVKNTKFTVKVAAFTVQNMRLPLSWRMASIAGPPGIQRRTVPSAVVLVADGKGV